MPSITPHTVAELIYWSYANLAMAHDGINRGLPTYDKTSFIIRMRMYKGLLSGKLQISSLFKDERWKMENGARCVYCGSIENLSVDHLFPRIKGGADNVENLVCSCKSCNSSKGKINNWKKWTIPPFLSVCRKYRQTSPNALKCL